jgi:hypothetical protein
VTVNRVKGIAVYVNDCNVIQTHTLGIAVGGGATSGLYVKDSADCVFDGLNIHGSGGPVLVLDNCILNTFAGRIGFSQVARHPTYNYVLSTNDEHTVLIKTTSKYNRLDIVADKPNKSGLYIDATSSENNVDIVVTEGGYDNAVAQPGIYLAGSKNVIKGTSTKTAESPGHTNTSYGVEFAANADFNKVNVEATDNPSGKYLLNATGTANNIIPDSVPADDIYIPVGAWEAITGTPVRGAVGGTRGNAWLFDSVADEIIETMIVVPANWTKMRFTVEWVNAGAGAGDVIWFVQSRQFVAGDSLNQADANSISQTTTAGTQDVLKETVGSSDLTVVAGKPIRLRVKRAATDVLDTLANDAGFIGLRVTRIA